MNLKDIDNIDVLAFFFPEFDYLRDFIFGFMFESQPTTILIYLGQWDWFVNFFLKKRCFIGLLACLVCLLYLFAHFSCAHEQREFDGCCSWVRLKAWK